jgi:hypothetical protein
MTRKKVRLIHLSASNVPKPRWIKAGIIRLSKNKKTLVLAIWDLDPKKWLILDVGDVFDVISGSKREVSILESTH